MKNDPPAPALLCDIFQAAKLLGVSERTLRDWLKAGLVPATRITSRGQWLFSPTRLEAWVAERMKGGAQ